MGHAEAADLLQATLKEEKAADKTLTALAEGGINQGAADGANPGDEKDESRASKPDASARSRHNRTIEAKR